MGKRAWEDRCQEHYRTLFALQEDFQPMTYGFKMASNVTDVRATGMMKEVEDELNRTIKVRQDTPGHHCFRSSCCQCHDCLS